MEVGPATQGELLAHRTILRWCDWLEAVIHQRIHRHWHLAPAAFHPDPEARYLAALGDAQRHLADLDPHAFLAWFSDLTAASEQFRDSPKWDALGRAFSAPDPQPWLYPDLDSHVIALWPLVKKHNWTYRDLLNVIRPALKRPDAYPADTEQNFATYCGSVLGLRKAGRGKTAANGKPSGYEIARKLCSRLEQPPTKEAEGK